MRHLAPRIDLRWRPDDDILRRKDADKGAQVAGRTAVPGKIRVLDDEQIEIAVRTRVTADPRSEEHDPIGSSHREDAPHNLAEQVGRRRVS